MTKFIDLIATFKSIILKITLITFIIKWIKKYSLIRKLWHIISMIGSTLLGLSMIDIYSYDFINWLKDTNIYKWYSELFNKPIVETKEPSSIMGTSNKNSITNEEINERDYQIIRKLQEVIHPKDGNQDPIINQIDEIENIPFYKNKYFIIGAIGITTLMSWYYFDEIKTGYGAIIDYLSSFRSTPPDDSTGNNSSSNTISNTMSDGSRLTVEDRIKQYFRDGDKTPKVIDKSSSEIELLDNSQPIANSSKGKGVLTSPSLENLNNQATESWGEGSSSPNSDTSSATITPNIKTDFTETQNSVTAEILTESPIDSTSSLIPSILDESPALDFLSKTWKLMFATNVKNKIRIIENSFEGEVPLDESRRNLLAKLLAQLMAEYDVQSTIFNKQICHLSPNDIISTRQSFYHFRQWIKIYSELILLDQYKDIDIGNINDNPKIIYTYDV